MYCQAIFLLFAFFAQAILGAWTPPHVRAYDQGGYDQRGYDKGSYEQRGFDQGGYGREGHAPTGGYRGPLAKVEFASSGFLADTPEVAAAKAAHMSLLSGTSHSPYASPEAAPYAAPYATPYAAKSAPYSAPVAPRWLADAPDSGLRGDGAYSSPRWQAGAPDSNLRADDGSYSSHYEDVSSFDDGSYKPHLYQRESH